MLKAALLGKRGVRGGAAFSRHTPFRRVSTTESRSTRRHECAVVIYNVAKRENIGVMLRTCAAMGAEVVVVGRKKQRLFGSMQTRRHVPRSHFYTVPEAEAYLRRRSFEIVGVEIADEARDINRVVFEGSTAFWLGNEGEGLSPAVVALCDRLVYVPQYGQATACLNVATTLGIALNAFRASAGGEEAPRSGSKFEVDRVAAGEADAARHAEAVRVRREVMDEHRR